MVKIKKNLIQIKGTSNPFVFQINTGKETTVRKTDRTECHYFLEMFTQITQGSRNRATVFANIFC